MRILYTNSRYLSLLFQKLFVKGMAEGKKCDKIRIEIKNSYENICFINNKSDKGAIYDIKK